MKLAVIYDSKTGNTKQAAGWITEGMNSVAGVEAAAFSIESVDEEFVREAKGVVVGSPSYAAEMTPAIHDWLLSSGGKVELAGKLGGGFATVQFTHGGGETGSGYRRASVIRDFVYLQQSVRTDNPGHVFCRGQGWEIYILQDAWSFWN